MTPEAARPHTWYADRLAEFRGEWLEPDESAEVRAHVEACERCQAALARMADPPVVDDPLGRHIPRAVIARWDRAQQRMTTFERRLVQEHLDSCAECRQDLELVGFVPTLQAARAEDPSPLAALPARSTVQRAATEGARRGVDRIRLALGGWALAATAFAAWLAVMQPGPVPVPGPRATQPGTGTPAPMLPGSSGTPGPTGSGTQGALPTSGASPDAAPRPIQLALLPDIEPGARSAGDTVRATAVRPTQRQFVLEIPLSDLPELPPGTATRVELISPAHRTVLTADFELADLLANRLFVVSLASVESGRYSLRVSFPNRPAAAVERHFVLAVRAR